LATFVPSIVQYITLNPDDKISVEHKWPLVLNYFRSTLTIIQQKWASDNKSGILNTISAILAVSKVTCAKRDCQVVLF